MVTESDHIVAETAARIFADLADPQTINNARDDRWKTPLWRALTDAGLTARLGSRKRAAAARASPMASPILGVAGRYALPVPLAETMLAGWLLAQADIEAPAGAMTVAPVRPRDRISRNADGTLSGRADAVPFATDAQHIAVVTGDAKGAAIALVNAADCRIGGGETLAGDAGESS